MNSQEIIWHLIPIAPYNLDPNVDVIYICPVKATEEFVEYYMKLINIICSVNNLSYEQVKEKIKFITPEHFDRFPVSYYLHIFDSGWASVSKPFSDVLDG